MSGQAPEPIENPGPIQILTLAFPGSRFKGEILPALERLKRRRIVRVLDMMLVRKDSAGKVMVMTGSDLDWDEATALGSYFGGLTGLATGGDADSFERGSLAGAAELADGHIFDEQDVFQMTQALPDDMTAAVLLIEHTWARSLFDAVDRADGIELLNEWLQPDAVLQGRLRELGS